MAHLSYLQAHASLCFSECRDFVVTVPLPAMFCLQCPHPSLLQLRCHSQEVFPDLPVPMKPYLLSLTPCLSLCDHSASSSSLCLGHISLFLYLIKTLVIEFRTHPRKPRVISSSQQSIFTWVNWLTPVFFIKADAPRGQTLHFSSCCISSTHITVSGTEIRLSSCWMTAGQAPREKLPAGKVDQVTTS